MRNHFRVLLVLTFLFNRMPVCFAADNPVDAREAAVDRAIGGMEEGSRPLEPEGYAGKTQAHPVPGGNLSPAMDARSTASAPVQNITGSSPVGSGANLGGSTVVETPTGGSTKPVSNPTEPVVESITQPVTEQPAEPATEPGGSSIINVDAGVDLSGESPAVDANLTVDTNADNLLDADAAAATNTTSTDITAAESGTVAGEDLSTAVNDAPVDAVLSAEVVATDTPTDSEATAGLEADVDPVTADSDTASTNPADGLTAAL